MRRVWLSAFGLLFLVACRGGAAGRAASLPHPTDIGGWVALAVFILGGWWLLLKLLRG
jgi:hypothetical protein